MKIKIFPALLSIFITILFLWIEISPYGTSVISDKLKDILLGLDYTRYTVKTAILLDKINIKSNPNKIIVVNIQDSKHLLEADKISNKYNTMKDIIDALLKGKPKVIASDVVITHSLTELSEDIEKTLKQKVFNFPQTLKLLQEYDENLKKMIVKNNIILPILQTQGAIQYGRLPKPITKLKAAPFPLYNINGYITNYQALQSSIKYSGFTSTVGNTNYANSKYPLLFRNNLDIYPSLALAIAMQIFPENAIKLNTTKIGNKIYLKSIKFGDQIIPTSNRGYIYTPFYKGAFAPEKISASVILDEAYDLNNLQDAIVILNTNLDPLGTNFDVLQTKYNINAQISMLNSILSKVYLYSPYWGELLNIYLIIALGIIVILCFSLLSTGLSLLILFSIYMCLLITNFVLFYYNNIVLNVSAPIVLGFLLTSINMIFSWLFEAHKKMRIKNFFAQYVPVDYLNLLLDNPNSYGFDGKSEELTVLFADIRNFTGISEHLDASGVKKLLNKIFTPLTCLILKNGGTVDKYVGDMVMAFFGAPIANLNHRESALNCALEMLAYTKKMRKTFIAQGLPPLELSIGLNSGMMNVGDMGSEFRRAYTVIGDAVNLGSRIQSITAYYGVKLLVGSATCHGQSKFVFRMIDKVKLKGKTSAEIIYEVVGRTKSTRDYVLQEIQDHQTALDAYFAKNWDLAIHLFANLADKYPGYKVYTIFLERSQNYKIHNPPEDWDGSHTFSEK